MCISPILDQIGKNIKVKKEIWKKVKRFNWQYEVSNYGQVRSWKFQQFKDKTRPYILNQNKDESGRPTVMLWDKGTGYRIKTGKLVLEAFRGPCPKGMEMCHNDGNAMNNHIDNLRWDTHINNCKDRKMHGTEKGFFKKGHKPVTTKLTKDDIVLIKEMCKTMTQTEVSHFFPVSLKQINNIMRGRSWT